jgi:hypothetical protein
MAPSAKLAPPPRYAPWLLLALCVALAAWAGSRPRPLALYSPKLVSPLGSGARNTVLQDLDGDGRLDLAIATMDEYQLFNPDPATDTSAIGIWLSEAAGLRRHAWLHGLHANLLVGGDLDRDGDVDLLTGNSQGDHLTILLNDGHAHYRRAGRLPAHSPHNLALGDMDKDGDLDLVLRGAGCAIAIGRNDGRAHFRLETEELGALWPEEKNSGQPYADRRGYCPREIALADVDRDGDLDIVTMNDQNARQDNTLSVIYNGPHGKLQSEQLVWATNFVANLTIGDLNNDGWPDLMLTGINAGGNGQNIAYVLLNDHHGSFGNPNITIGGLDNGEWDYNFASGPTLSRKLDMGPAYLWRGALGDVDHDGDLDLVVIDSWGKMQVRRNRGNATFDEPYQLPTGLVYHEELALGDLDSDGQLEWLTPRPVVARSQRLPVGRGPLLFYKLR